MDLTHMSLYTPIIRIIAFEERDWVSHHIASARDATGHAVPRCCLEYVICSEHVYNLNCPHPTRKTYHVEQGTYRELRPARFLNMADMSSVAGRSFF